MDDAFEPPDLSLENDLVKKQQRGKAWF